MDEERKCAILDTDFVSKANIIKTETSVLADEVLEFPDYQFFCHQKMKEELGNHGTEEAQLWLERKTSSGEITCYSDEQIITEMREKIHESCYGYYRSFLKQGCDLFDARQGFANGAQISCISILSVFLKMWLIGKKIEEVQPFFWSFVRWCTNRKNPQTHVRVWVFKEGSYKRERMPVTSILPDIYEGLYCARKNGDLQRIK